MFILINNFNDDDENFIFNWAISFNVSRKIYPAPLCISVEMRANFLNAMFYMILLTFRCWFFVNEKYMDIVVFVGKIEVLF